MAVGVRGGSFGFTGGQHRSLRAGRSFEGPTAGVGVSSAALLEGSSPLEADGKGGWPGKAPGPRAYRRSAGSPKSGQAPVITEPRPSRRGSVL